MARFQDDEVAGSLSQNLIDRIALEQGCPETPLACAHYDEIVLFCKGLDRDVPCSLSRQEPPFMFDIMLLEVFHETRDIV